MIEAVIASNADVKAWFEDDTAEPSMIEEFAQRFRNLDLRKETKRWHVGVQRHIQFLLVL